MLCKTVQSVTAAAAAVGQQHSVDREICFGSPKIVQTARAEWKWTELSLCV